MTTTIPTDTAEAVAAQLSENFYRLAIMPRLYN